MLGSSRRAALILAMATAHIVAPSALGQPFSFTRIAPDAPYINYGDVSFGDIDGDGLHDLLVLGNRRNTAPFLPTTYQALASPEVRDATSGAWRLPLAVSDLSTGLWHGSVDWRDFDGDGDLDAVISGASTVSEPFAGATILLVNNGDGLLVETPAALPGLYGSTARWGDYDGDGDVDLLLVGAETDDSFRTILLDYEPDPGNGVGTFTEVPTELPNVSYGDVAWADFDNDGDQDIVLAGALTDGTVVADVFVNTAGTFAPMNAGLPRVAFASADWGDYDGDGDLDLVISGGTLSDVLFDGLVHVYRNDGSSFALATVLLQSFYGDVSWADYDNDGHLDLLVAGSAGATGDRAARIYHNEDNSFIERSFLTGVSFASGVWADYDGDLDTDIVLSGLDRSGATVLNIYRNEQRTPNTAPSIPTNLAAASADGVVTLSWDSSTDEQSGSASLSYNVRMGTTPGSSDIISASTTSGTDRRLVSARGNTDLSTSLRLELPQGEYHWSVQAIDASFAASDFAADAVVNVVGKDSQTSSEDPQERAAFALGEPYPNPSSGALTLEYSLPGGYQAGEAVMTVFDLLGSVVIRSRPQAGAGLNVWRWDGRGATGERVASGLYFVQLRTANDAAVRTVLLVDQGR